MTRSWVFVTLAVLVAQNLATATALRGVDPEKARFYNGDGGKFTCTDGSKTVPFANVNDNYCDCADGSDEPGTAACYRGRFYCKNYGHEVKFLSSAFVDDGVCDCCDGSDELGGCTNTCLEKSAAKKQVLLDELAEYALSLAKKAEYAAVAKTKRAEWSARLGVIDGEIMTQQTSIPGFKAAVVRLEVEKAEQERLDAIKAAEQAVLDAAAEVVRLAAEAAAAEAEAAAAAAAGLPAPVTEEEAPPPPAEGDAAATEEHEETNEERGRRIASQWTHDPDAAQAEGDAAGPIDEEHLPDPDAEYGSSGDFGPGDEHMGDESYEPHHHTEDDDAGSFDAGEEEAAPPPPHRPNRHQHVSHTDVPLPPGIEYWEVSSHAGSDSGTDLGSARIQAGAAELKVTRLLKEKADLQRWTKPGLDWGTDDVWMALAGKCYSSTASSWTYEACLFGHATQKEGVNLANLGAWQGFEDSYGSALFGGGDLCHGTTPRSFRLTLFCGKEESLFEISEPSTCVYTASFMSPAACSQADQDAVQGELDVIEALERDVRREIAEAAAAQGQAAEEQQHGGATHEEL